MKKSLRYSILAVIILVIVGISAAAAVWLGLRNNASDQKKGSSAQAPRQNTPAEQKTNEAEKLALSGDVAGGVEMLDKAIKNSSDVHAKFLYYSQKAVLLFNDNKLDSALMAAKQAYNLEQIPDSAAFVGQVARAKGEKTMAVEYYKKAAALVKTDSSPMAERDKAYYESVVAELEAGK